MLPGVGTVKCVDECSAETFIRGWTKSQDESINVNIEAQVQRERSEFELKSCRTSRRRDSDSVHDVGNDAVHDFLLVLLVLGLLCDALLFLYVVLLLPALLIASRVPMCAPV